MTSSKKKAAIKEAMKVLKWFTESLTENEGNICREVVSTLQGYEHPGFTAHQVTYWLANDYHSGQSSPGYAILSTSEYKPGPNETVEELQESDYDFDIFYTLLESYAQSVF